MRVYTALSSSAVAASPLAVLGINMGTPEFMAGMFLSMPAYYFGRQIWKEHGRVGFWLGFAMALFMAVIVAAAPGIIPLDVPVQIKMAISALAITILVARAEKEGRKFANGDD